MKKIEVISIDGDEVPYDNQPLHDELESKDVSSIYLKSLCRTFIPGL